LSIRFSLAATLLSTAALAALALSAAAAPASAAPTPTYAVTGKVAGPDGSWDYVSFDAAHRKIYVSRSNGVSALDVDTGVLTPHLADGSRTHSVIVAPGGDTLIITNGAPPLANMVSAADGKLITSIPIGPLPDAGVFDPGSNLAIVVSATGLTTLIDPASKTVAATVQLPGKLEFIAPDGKGLVFIAVESKNEIAVLDTKTKALKTLYPLPGCDSPGGLAYDAKAGVLITSCDGGVAMIVSAKTGAVLATLAIGKGPDAVIFDAVRGLAFIPCGQDGVLDVIKVGAGANAKLIQVVKTERGARTGMVDTKTGKLYLPAATYGPPPAAGGRPAMVPGSFHLVVVSPG
jgi:hypothetical protein